ncbi:hypothetical protein VT84_06895 [Gemmata sp. SH-PL17]|uniref:DUF4190 domain-containing protein n=1 Tax=Gemmata sp. SH-PL17 TaxID=1630693 RepID=UPI0004ADF2D0|nr:DUF4190 domain-containing protein [Gemmata sp. SH-PL17]AMV24106.1 hypothetical protein VT84_06895 [Gemmata sp. SH-PL17]
MAEPTQSPALPSTADATPYVPISWTAVAAAVTAGVFAITLLMLGIFAFISKKPLLMQELLVLPVIAVVLSFAARRIIRNSEGTRTGEGLANAAWWASLVLGLGYVAYLFAIDYSVRRDAANKVEEWIGQVRDDKVGGAFYTTLLPQQRQGVSRSDTSLIEMRFRDEFLTFRNSDLVRLAQRNKAEGEFKFTSVGVADWSYKPGAIDCAFAGTVTCPEGTFPVLVKLRGVEGVTASEGGGGRQWAVAFQPGSGFIQQDKVERTAYGWMLVLLEINGGSFGKGFIEYINSGPFTQPFAYQGFIAEGGVPSEAVAGSRNGTVLLTSFVPLGVAAAGQGGYTRHMADSVFKLPGGGEPSSGQKEKFLASWKEQGIFEAGRRLKDPNGGVPDKDVILKITDTAVEVFLPIEIPIQNTTGRAETARGKVVVACKDPGLLAELKARKASAVGGEKPTSSPPQELTQWVNLQWRVVRIESDLNPVSMHQTGQGGPGGGGPPPGMGGGPGMHGG